MWYEFEERSSAKVDITRLLDIPFTASSWSLSFAALLSASNAHGRLCPAIRVTGHGGYIH